MKNGKLLNSILAGTALLGATALAPAKELPNTSEQYKIAKQNTDWVDSICIPYIMNWERKNNR